MFPKIPEWNFHEVHALLLKDPLYAHLHVTQVGWTYKTDYFCTRFCFLKRVGKLCSKTLLKLMTVIKKQNAKKYSWMVQNETKCQLVGLYCLWTQFRFLYFLSLYCRVFSYPSTKINRETVEEMCGDTDRHLILYFCLCSCISYCLSRSLLCYSFMHMYSYFRSSQLLHFFHYLFGFCFTLLSFIYLCLCYFCPIYLISILRLLHHLYSTCSLFFLPTVI